MVGRGLQEQTPRTARRDGQRRTDAEGFTDGRDWHKDEQKVKD